MNITKGTKSRPVKIVITGPEGIGKSTLASKCPKPLFIDTEHGTELLDLDRVDDVNDWNSLLCTISEFCQGGHGYKTLVIDTADWAEIWCIRQLCINEKVTSIEKVGYGKGYTILQEMFGKLLSKLNDCIACGYNVVLVAHNAMRKFEEPDQTGSYDRWELKLSKKVAPMVKEWADAVFFINYRTKTVTTSENKVKAVAGDRVIYTQHHACWDAKNRFGLADCLPLEFKSIQKCFGILTDKQKLQAYLMKAGNKDELVEEIKGKYKVKGFADLTEEQSAEILSAISGKAENKEE